MTRTEIRKLIDRLEVLALDFREPDPTNGEYYDRDGRTIIDAIIALEAFFERVDS